MLTPQPGQQSTKQNQRQRKRNTTYLRGFRRCFCSVIKSAPSCIYYRLYDLKKSVQLIVTYPILIPKRDYIRYIENEKTLDNIRKIVTDSDTEKWRGIGILRIGGKSNGRI